MNMYVQSLNFNVQIASSTINSRKVQTIISQKAYINKLENIGYWLKTKRN